MENKLRARYLIAIALLCTGLSGMLQASYSSFTLTNHSDQNLKVRFNGGNNISLNINSSTSVPVSTNVTIQTNTGWESWNASSKLTSDTYEIVSYTMKNGRSAIKVQAVQS